MLQSQAVSATVARCGSATVRFSWILFFSVRNTCEFQGNHMRFSIDYPWCHWVYHFQSYWFQINCLLFFLMPFKRRRKRNGFCVASRVTRHSYHFYLASFFSISFASILTVLIRPVISIWFCVYLFCALWIRTTFALLFIQCKFCRIGRENILLPLVMANRIEG